MAEKKSTHELRDALVVQFTEFITDLETQGVDGLSIDIMPGALFSVRGVRYDRLQEEEAMIDDTVVEDGE